ncbi:hypothetical protein [Blastococcus sp. Marseille-P5729]|uniref:hypothetical protein n=1 Tax=Blastococcus sp. Marseille-P5729 TaxID=2086582 RepID=UPI000D112088|nr:hypothetical protein [Blastococcus sp. Marseille-P5729]
MSDPYGAGGAGVPHGPPGPWGQSGPYGQPAASGQPGAYGAAPYPPPQPLIPTTPPPRSYDAYDASVPDPQAAMRYAEAVAAEPQIGSLPTTPRPASAYELGYAQLPPERFYQFKMWLQSPEGQNYREWEDEARKILDVLEPFNARWVQGWMSAEMALLRPVRDYLDIYDQYTQQLLTYADLNPAARRAQLFGQDDPANPLPVEVLMQRLPERSRLQERLASYDEFWREQMGIEFATGWKTSWGPADHDPFVIAASLRQITDNVTARLWSASQLPDLPALPVYAPSATGIPRSMTALQQQLCQLAGGEELPAHTVPEPFHPPSLPSPLAPAHPRWSRGEFYTGRAVACRGRTAWAEGVALEGVHGPTVKVQRYDGSLGWFPVNEVRGIR